MPTCAKDAVDRHSVPTANNSEGTKRTPSAARATLKSLIFSFYSRAIAERRSVPALFPCGQRCETSFAGQSQQRYNVCHSPGGSLRRSSGPTSARLGPNRKPAISCRTPDCVGVVRYIRQIGGAERAEPAHGNAKVRYGCIPTGSSRRAGGPSPVLGPTNNRDSFWPLRLFRRHKKVTLWASGPNICYAAERKGFKPSVVPFRAFGQWHALHNGTPIQTGHPVGMTLEPREAPGATRFRDCPWSLEVFKMLGSLFDPRGYIGGYVAGLSPGRKHQAPVHPGERNQDAHRRARGGSDNSGRPRLAGTLV